LGFTPVKLFKDREEMPTKSRKGGSWRLPISRDVEVYSSTCTKMMQEMPPIVKINAVVFIVTRLSELARRGGACPALHTFSYIGYIREGRSKHRPYDARH